MGSQQRYAGFEQANPIDSRITFTARCGSLQYLMCLKYQELTNQKSGEVTDTGNYRHIATLSFFSFSNLSFRMINIQSALSVFRKKNDIIYKYLASEVIPWKLI